MSDTMSEIIMIDTQNADIELTIYEYTINIFGSLLREYDKIQIIEDYCVEGLADTNTFFQEENVIDYATGKHTADSTVMKIIKFIPKLFIGMGRACVSIIKGDVNDKDPEKTYSRASANLAKATPQQLNQVGMEVKQMTDGSVTFDTRKSEFWFGEKYRHLQNWVRIIKGFGTLGKDIKNFIENDSNEYKTLAEEMKKLINKEKSIDQGSLRIGLDALHQIMKEGQAGAGAISGLADELSHALAKKMDKDFANGKDPQKWADAKALLDSIYEVNIDIHNFARVYNWSTKIINFIGNDRKFFGFGKNAGAGGRTGEEKVLGWMGKKLGINSAEEAEANQNLANAEAAEKEAIANKHSRDAAATNSDNATKTNAEAMNAQNNANNINAQSGEKQKPGVLKRAANNVGNFMKDKFGSNSH